MTNSSKNESIVISQPYFFPWIGIFELIRLSDIYVHYDDVQFSKGHFHDRVQIKTVEGFKWLTVPKLNLHLGQNLCEVEIDNNKNWKNEHIDLLKQVYKSAPFVNEMILLVLSVYNNQHKYLSELTISSVDALTEYLKLKRNRIFKKSSELHIDGKSTERVLRIVKFFNATTYISAMGALKYFDFDLFEQNKIKVEIINYNKKAYPQLYGIFNPFVSILDLIANIGKEGINYISSEAMDWKDFSKTEMAKSYLGQK